MNRTRIIFAMLVAASMATWAQESAPTPVAEVGLNVSFANLRPGTGVPSFTASGASGTFVYNFNRVLGVVGDFGGYHNKDDVNFNPTTLTYLVGPRISIRKSRFTPYVQALFGGARQTTSFVDPNSGLALPANTGFAGAFGGGLDIRVKKHILIKPLQVEYLMTRVTNPWSTADTQNNVRYSAGVVFTLGSK